LVPKTPDPEVQFAYVDVVEEHHGPTAKLGPPALKVVSKSLVGMQAVNVQKIDAAISEMV
jgi:hypothetical protein